MRPRDILLFSTNGLKERKFRFILNLVGVLVGCIAITGLISLTQGLNEEVGGQLDRFGSRNLFVMPGDISMGAGLIATQGFNWRDLEIISRVDNIDKATPVMGNLILTYSKRGEKKQAFAYGIEADYFTIQSGWGAENGRLLKRGDNAVVILGYEIAFPKDMDEPLFEVGDRITLTVRVDGEDKDMSFRVIGIMEKMGGLGGVSSDEDNSVFMPLRICQQFFEKGGEFQYIVAQVKDTNDLVQVTADIEDRFDDDVSVLTRESMSELVGNILGAIEAVLGGVAALSLFVAGVGIINTMTISVLERTREIGILKAIGAKKKDILLMFLSEAVLNGLIGGSLGAAIGFGIGNLVGNLIEMPVSSNLFLALGVVLFALLTCGLSGLYPAWRAAKMHPVEALRAE